ncbi:VOC family protein [Micromonospora sp. NPDC005171]|uniref:VOC family protein n=1 Tax=Micromonospora sp. NPDC005171 TaxID=3156866 RepID=UPI00339EC286
MEQRISLITLGVADVARAKAFYEQLGWRGQEVEETVFFQAGGLAVVLWGRDKLADDASIEDGGTDGFGGVALAQNVRSRAEVDEVIATATKAGATVTSQPGRPSTAVTPATSPTRTATCGRSPGTRASPSPRAAP